MGLPHVRRGAGKDVEAGAEIEDGGQRPEVGDVGVMGRSAISLVSSQLERDEFANLRELGMECAGFCHRLSS